MTNKEIMTIFEGLINLREDASIRLPASTSFAITRNFRILQPIVEDIESTRSSILQAYGVEDEERPGYFIIPPEKRNIATQELADLESAENNIDLLKIKLSSLNGINLPLKIMDGLYSIIQEEES